MSAGQNHRHDHGDHGDEHSHGSGLPDLAVADTELIRNRAAARMFRPIRGRLITAAVMAFLAGAVSLLPFVSVAEIAKELLSSGPVDRSDVWRWVWIGIAGAGGHLFLNLLANEISHYADSEFQRILRIRILRHVGALPLGWLVTRGSAELKKALNDDVEDMHPLVAHVLNEMATATGMPLAAVAYLFAVDWRMMCVLLGLLVAASWFIKLSMRGFPERIAELTVAHRRINAATIEYVDGIEVVKAFGESGQAYRRFADAVNDYALKMKAWSADITRSYDASLLLLSPSTALLAVLVAGTWLVSRDSIAAVDVLPFVLVGVGLTAPFQTLGQGAQLLRRARLAATHVEQILETPPLPEPASPRVPTTYDIEFDEVSFSYDGDGDALQDVDVVCPAGTVTALVGPSGSGKTTLTRLVPRFFDVSSGAIRIGGVDVREIDSRELLRRIAMVFQDVVLLRDTVRENIRLGRPDAPDSEVEAAARAARIHDVVMALPQGYDTVLGESGGFVSGGERQRLTIARAILQDAPIVILDEATAFADPENEAAVQDALAELTAGKTVFVIAHRLHTITHADQILVLDRGNVVERGTHDELLARHGLYADLWQAQERALRHADADLPEVKK